MALDPKRWEVERVAERGAYSLAAQVIYQCRILAILRERPDRAAELLRNPVALQAEYKAQYPENFRAVGVDDYY
jgi:hypothetical protein